MSTHSPRLCFVPAASFCLLAPLATASASDTSLAQEDVERVVVTAHRIERPLPRIGNSVTLIDSDAIRSSQKLLVSDLLATTPGVTVSRNGGEGATTALRIRGAETDQTVVLLDGVKLNDPSTAGGGYDFANLLTSDSMRIEVLRGPQSTLWGSQAIGGVVNIVTPVPHGPLSGSLTAEGGARGSGLVQARAEAGAERIAWRVAGTYLGTDGISAFDEDLGGKELDGYRNVGASARVLVNITDAVAAEARSTWSESRSEFDGYRPPTFAFTDTNEYGETEELVTYAGLNAQGYEGRLRHRFGFAYTDTERRNFDPDASVRQTFDATGRNERWEYQGTLALGERIEGVFGLESEQSRLTTASPSEFDPNPVPLARDARLDSAYGQLSVSPLDTLTLSAGLRHDDHETFGSERTGSATLAWSATPATIVRASYGEGFKAPTLFQLFSEYGNAALAPEQAQAWDLGLEQRLLGGALVVSAVYFERDTDNMIDFVSCFLSSDPRCATRPLGFYDNVQQTTADGVELEMSAQLGERLRLTATYTGLDAVNRAPGSNFGRELPRRPRAAFSGDVTYSWPFGLTTTLAVSHWSRSFDDAANTIRLDGYTVVDARAAFSIGERLEVFGRIENAFDEDYATAAHYGAVGRGAFVGVRQRF